MWAKCKLCSQVYVVGGDAIDVLGRCYCGRILAPYRGTGQAFVPRRSWSAGRRCSLADWSTSARLSLLFNGHPSSKAGGTNALRPAGTYCESLPAGLVPSLFSISPAHEDDSVTIVGTVWIDENADGIRQPSEPGVPGDAIHAWINGLLAILS